MTKSSRAVCGLLAAIALAAITPAWAKDAAGPTIVFVPAAGPIQPQPASGSTTFGPLKVQITNPGGPIKGQKVTFSVPAASGGLTCTISGGRNPVEAVAVTDTNGKAPLNQLRGHNSMSCKGTGQITVTAMALGASATTTAKVAVIVLTATGNNQKVHGDCWGKGARPQCFCSNAPITFSLTENGQPVAGANISYSDSNGPGVLTTNSAGNANYTPSGTPFYTLSGTASYDGHEVSYSQTCGPQYRKR